MTSRSKNYCSVPQCNNYLSESVSMHYFPRNPKLANEWKNRLKIGKSISKYMCVCSEHFTVEDFTPNTRFKKLKRLRKEVIPSQKIPNTNLLRKPKSRTDRKWLHTVPVVGEDETETDNENVLSDEDYSTMDEAVLLSLPEPKQNYGNNTNPLNSTLDELTDVATQTSSHTYDLGDNLHSDYNMQCFTGVDTTVVKTLIGCSENILNLNSEEIPDNLQTRIVVVLTKLKCNHSFRCLAILFNLSYTTCRRYFHWTLPLLATVLKPLIKWPSKEEIVANMPACFKKFPNTRVVLDCIEVPVQKSECLVSRMKSYAHYKSTLTIKILIGITPSGVISYISPCYAGRASDKSIFNTENFISKLDPFDGVMVDKGFMLDQECEEYFIQLIQPPFPKKNKQLTKKEVNQTAEIARARIHVERTVQKLKRFKMISSQIEWHMIPHMDEVMTVVAGLVLMSPAIISSEQF